MQGSVLSPFVYGLGLSCGSSLGPWETCQDLLKLLIILRMEEFINGMAQLFLVGSCVLAVSDLLGSDSWEWSLLGVSKAPGGCGETDVPTSAAFAKSCTTLACFCFPCGGGGGFALDLFVF